MRKVKLLSPMVGNTIKDGKVVGHWSFSKGDVVELPVEEAKRFIERGYATAFTEK